MKSLSNVFVGLLAAGFGLILFLWQKEKEANEEAREKISQYSETIKKQNIAMARFNKEKAREMVREIKDEVQNLGIPFNQGLKDTIQLIFKNREALFEKPEPSRKSILAFCEMLRGFYESVLLSPLSSIEKKDHPVYSKVPDLTDENLWKQDLLEKENQMYQLFEGRLGAIRCFGGPKHLMVFSNPQSLEVKEGEPFTAQIGLYQDPQVLPGIDVEMFPKIGTITDELTNEKSTRTLYIPTEGLLQPNQNKTTVSYGLEFIIPLATGGYGIIGKAFEFTVVAPCDPLH